MRKVPGGIPRPIEKEDKWNWKVKDPELFNDEMRDYLDRALEHCEKTFIPYRQLINSTFWLDLRENYPDVYNDFIGGREKYDLIGKCVPRKYGGSGWTTLQSSMVDCEKVRMARAVDYANIVYNGEFGVTTTHNWAKTEKVRKHFYEKCLKGCSFTQWATEEVGGIDPTQWTGTAVRDGNDYIINSNKWWMCATTGGWSNANFHTVIVKTDPNNPNMLKQFSAFFIDHDMPGIVHGRQGKLFGGKFGPRHEVKMDNVRVPKAYLCGEEGDGYWVMQDAVNLNLGDQSWLLIGAAEACMETVIDYALKTYRFGHYIWEYQGISFPIAEMAIQTEAARALARQTSSLYDKRDPEVRRLGAIGYRFAGDSALWVATKSMELVGASAIELGEGLPIEQLLRDITLGTMMRTPNMDRMYIAQRTIGKRPTMGRTQYKAA